MSQDETTCLRARDEAGFSLYMKVLLSNTTISQDSVLRC